MKNKAPKANQIKLQVKRISKLKREEALKYYPDISNAFNSLFGGFFKNLGMTKNWL
jgi:hypothetical protein